MATEESSQGAALGPEICESVPDHPAAEAGYPDLHVVLADFMTAMSVIDAVRRSLWYMMEDSSEEIGSTAIALSHGYQMLEEVYNRFDEGLIPFRQSGDEDELEGASDDDADGKAEEGNGAAAAAVSDSGNTEVTAGSRLNEQEHQSRPILHRAHRDILLDQRHRMMDVQSALDVARCVLRHEPDVNIEGTLSVARDLIGDIIEKLDEDSIAAAVEKWLADEARQEEEL